MRKTILTVAFAAISLPAFAADALSTYFDGEFKGVERDVVGLAQAMPADKYAFAPTNSIMKGAKYDGVRTFGEELKHLAATIYAVAGAALGEKPPADLGPKGDGPDAMKSKDEILAYTKGAFAYGHKAIATLTVKNQLEKVKGPYGGDMLRIETANMPTWHSFDHYGQMVEYARMNGVIPPASLPAPPPPAKK